MVFEVPASCTLPTARRPVRVAELGAPLATALSGEALESRRWGPRRRLAGIDGC